MRWIRYLWAFPATVGGLMFVVLAWLSGGTVAVVDGAIEVHGGLVSRFLRRGFLGFGPAAARTIGHVILGADQECLHACRVHEHVHVRQFERWGPLFQPLYVTASLVAWWRGRDPYRDNPFEREAFAAEARAASHH